MKGRFYIMKKSVFLKVLIQVVGLTTFVSLSSYGLALAYGEVYRYIRRKRLIKDIEEVKALDAELKKAIKGLADQYDDLKKIGEDPDITIAVQKVLH